MFRSVVLMSAPFTGPPALPFGRAAEPRGGTAAKPSAGPSIHDALAALPRPRKHYHQYYSTRAANRDMWHPPQGVHDFLRAYYHHKSADWNANRPFPLKAGTAEDLAQPPTYHRRATTEHR